MQSFADDCTCRLDIVIAQVKVTIPCTASIAGTSLVLSMCQKA